MTFHLRASGHAGWLALSMIIVPILDPSCMLKLVRFSAKLRIHDEAECGKKWIRSELGNTFDIVSLDVGLLLCLNLNRMT